jgi:hypothetical protein
MGALAGAPTVQAATRCDRTGKTVARTSAVRIYRDGSKGGSGKKVPRYFACLRHAKTAARRLPVAAADTVGFMTLHSFRITGHFVAYVQRGEYPEDLSESVWSLSVATGTSRLYYSTDGFFDVTSLVVNRIGSVAYIDRNVASSPNYPDRKPATFHVYRGVGGKRLQLDSGEDIDPESLTVVGSEVRWVRGGQPRSAPF